MHSATPATGRPTQPPGKTVAKNRPAPLTTRPTHTPRAPHSQQNRMSQSHIHASPATNRAVCVPERVSRDTPISNRHTSRLENAISLRKQTLGTLSNRHFFTFLARNFAPTHRAPRKPLTISNRQSQILEIAVTNTKQTLAARSNRQYFASLARAESTNSKGMPASSPGNPYNTRQGRGFPRYSIYGEESGCEGRKSRAGPWHPAVPKRIPRNLRTPTPSQSNSATPSFTR